MVRIHIDQLIKNIFVSRDEEVFKNDRSSSLQILPIEFFEGKAVGVFCVDLLDQGFKRVEVPVGFSYSNTGTVSRSTIKDPDLFVDISDPASTLILNLTSCRYKQGVGKEISGKFTENEGSPFFTLSLDYAMAQPIPFSVFLTGSKKKLMTLFENNKNFLDAYNDSTETISKELEVNYKKIKQLPLLEEADIVIPKQKITHASFIEQVFKKRHNPVITEEDLKQVKV